MIPVNPMAPDIDPGDLAKKAAKLVEKGADKVCDVNPTCKASKDVTKTAAKTVEHATDKVTQVADFMSDPLGYIATSIQKSCESLAKELFAALAKALHPDYGLQWFVSAYQVAFALGIILMGFLVTAEFVAYRKGQRGADEMLGSVITSIPKFFLGVLMGPLIGNLLSQTVGSLCDGLIKWGGGGNGGIKSAGDGITTMLALQPGTAMVGGSALSILVFIVFLIALVFVAITMLFLLVVAYFGGAAFPIGWAWITSSRNKDTAFKVVNMIVGVMLSPVIVFLMLGVAMSMSRSNLLGEGGDNGKTITHLLNILVSLIALMMSAFVPFVLTKFAPIGIRASEGASMRMPSGGSRGGAGKSSSSDGQLGQISRSRSSSSSPSTGASSSSGLGKAPVGGGLGGGGMNPSAGGAAAGGGAAAAAGPAGVAVAAGQKAYEKGKQTAQTGASIAEEASNNTSGGNNASSGSAETTGPADGGQMGATSRQQGASRAGQDGGNGQGAGSGAPRSQGGSPFAASALTAGGGSAGRSNSSDGGGQLGTTARQGQQQGSGTAAGPSAGAGSAGGQMGATARRSAQQGGGAESGNTASSGSSSGTQASVAQRAGQAARATGSALNRVQQASERVAGEAAKHTHHQEGGHR